MLQNDLSNQGQFIRYIRDQPYAKILEIGPGAKPRLVGENVYYFDVKSEQELHRRYEGVAELKSIPEKIHFAGVDLRCIGEKFDAVFSCHMIEHTFDLIEHINGVGDILKPGGSYFIIVPDKNYTFDYFKPVSTVEEVVDRHITGPHKLALKTVLLEKGRRTHNDARRHWSGDHGKPTYDKEDILRAIRNFEQIRNDPISASGFHNWIFTHKSFAEVMKKLMDLELITMKMEACFPTPVDTFSFNAVLTTR